MAAMIGMMPRGRRRGLCTLIGLTIGTCFHSSILSVNAWSMVSVKHLPGSMSPQLIKGLFSEVGRVVHCSVHGAHPEDLLQPGSTVYNHSMLAAEVLFQDHEKAVEAVRLFNGKTFAAPPLNCPKPTRKRPNPECPPRPPLIVTLLKHAQDDQEDNAVAEATPGNVMHTFHQIMTHRRNSEDIWSRDDAQLAVWRSAWAEAGWIPIVLTIADAERHPNYAELRGEYCSIITHKFLLDHHLSS